jgi:hypothetical protein
MENKSKRNRSKSPNNIKNTKYIYPIKKVKIDRDDSEQESFNSVKVNDELKNQQKNDFLTLVAFFTPYPFITFEEAIHSFIKIPPISSPTSSNTSSDFYIPPSPATFTYYSLSNEECRYLFNF